MPGVIGRPAPQHVYSAVVKNKTHHDLTVKATYEMPHGGVDHFEVMVPPNGLVALPQKLISEDTCTLTGHITALAVSGENMSAELKGPYNVHSPTKDHPFFIAATESGLILSEGQGE